MCQTKRDQHLRSFKTDRTRIEDYQSKLAFQVGRVAGQSGAAKDEQAALDPAG